MLDKFILYNAVQTRLHKSVLAALAALQCTAPLVAGTRPGRFAEVSDVFGHGGAVLEFLDGVADRKISRRAFDVLVPLQEEVAPDDRGLPSWVVTNTGHRLHRFARGLPLLAPTAEKKKNEHGSST